MTKIVDLLRSDYNKLRPFMERKKKPEDAIKVQMVDNKIVNEDLVFSAWQRVDDRFAMGGGFSARQTWIILPKENAYRHSVFDEHGNQSWLSVYGTIELLQFKSKSITETCTIIGDLSLATIEECT